MNPDSNVAPDASVGELMTRLSEQTSRLVRQELLLAQAELKSSAKHAGIGAGVMGASLVLVRLGVVALVATAVIALNLVLPLWAAALIVTVALFAAAAVGVAVGKTQVQQVTEPPEHAVESIKNDIEAVKEAVHHDDAP